MRRWESLTGHFADPSVFRQQQLHHSQGRLLGGFRPHAGRCPWGTYWRNMHTWWFIPSVVWCSLDLCIFIYCSQWSTPGKACVHEELCIDMSKEVKKASLLWGKQQRCGCVLWKSCKVLEVFAVGKFWTNLHIRFLPCENSWVKLTSCRCEKTNTPEHKKLKCFIDLCSVTVTGLVLWHSSKP